MIIIGSMELKFTKRVGTFCCPQCEQERTFRLRTRREFLTVYFIPLIPLQHLGEFVECMTCRGAFDASAAEFTLEQLQAQKRRAAAERIRRALVILVAADEVVTDEELAVVREFTRRNGQEDVSRDQLLHEAASVRHAQMDPVVYLRHVAQQLGEEDKELLVYHAFLAATASGELSPQRQTLLAQMPDAIGIPEMRFREIVLRAVNHR